MRLKAVFIALCTATVLSLSGCTEYKYQIVGAGSACAYKIDRDTGQVWFVSPDGEKKLPNVP